MGFGVRSFARWAAVAAATAAVTAPRAARAEEKERPHVMREPGEVVDVADAFDSDNGDPFDFNFSLNYQYLSKRARITRETPIFQPGLTTGGFTSRTLEVGRFIQTTSILSPRIDIGLYKDLALYSYVPIVLSDEQRIDPLDGSDAANAPSTAGGQDSSGRPEQLFKLPFKAPRRSGVRYVGIGVDWGILNQARDWTKPTWVFGVETRISAGTPMHACNAAEDAIPCADPGDINRNGQFDATAVGAKNLPLEQQGLGTRTPGVTRGTIGVEIHSGISKRIKYVEPYGWLSALVEAQMGDSSEFGATNLQGALVNHPPIVGTISVGMMIHPWENREAYSRLTFDLRFDGSYHSEGRDYSEMFDALGSSRAGSLRQPKWARFRACTEAERSSGICSGETVSVIDEGAQKVYFNGLTVVEPFGSYRASGAVTYRIAKYVKLNFGLATRFDQAHGITHDQPCNPDFRDNVGEAGPCHFSGTGVVGATGIPNPAYRPTINAVGRRFLIDQSITYEIFARGTVLF
jgi:hypothetical protein